MNPSHYSDGTCMLVEEMVIELFKSVVKRLPQFVLRNNTVALHFFAIASWRE